MMYSQHLFLSSAEAIVFSLLSYLEFSVLSVLVLSSDNRRRPCWKSVPSFGWLSETSISVAASSLLLKSRFWLHFYSVHFFIGQSEMDWEMHSLSGVVEKCQRWFSLIAPLRILKNMCSVYKRNVRSLLALYSQNGCLWSSQVALLFREYFLIIFSILM